MTDIIKEVFDICPASYKSLMHEASRGFQELSDEQVLMLFQMLIGNRPNKLTLARVAQKCDEYLCTLIVMAAGTTIRTDIERRVQEILKKKEEICEGK